MPTSTKLISKGIKDVGICFTSNALTQKCYNMR